MLDYHGLEPKWIDSEEAARECAPSKGAWPCFFSPCHAMGEKGYEEFVGAGETSVEIGLEALHLVEPPPLPSTESLRAVFGNLARWREDPASCTGKEQIVDCLRQVVDTLQHVTQNYSLDKGM